MVDRIVPDSTVQLQELEMIPIFLQVYTGIYTLTSALAHKRFSMIGLLLQNIRSWVNKVLQKVRYDPIQFMEF